MSLPAMHGWTHRPKELGGTDPIPDLPTGGGTGPVAIDLRNPTTNAFFVAVTVTGFNFGRWQMVKDVQSDIYGAVLVPDTFTSLAVILKLSSVDTTTGDIRMNVSTRSVGVGEQVGGTLTAETEQTVSVGVNVSTVRFPATGSIGSSPAAGDLLIVDIFHNGTAGADTLSVDTALWGAWLEVS